MNSTLPRRLLPVLGSSYQAPFLKVMTSMALGDDIESERAILLEIKSLKRILEESKKREPLLCIIDEVLRGTNTVERIAASSRILNALRQNGCCLFAATHDIELSYILIPSMKTIILRKTYRKKRWYFPMS